MKKGLLALVLLLSAVVLAACGGEGVRGVKVVDGVTHIKVGNTASKTGAFGVVGVPFSAAIESVFKEFNESQDKYQIEYVTLDDATDPAIGSTNTKKLVEEEKIFALVGHVGTGTVGATLDYIIEENIPMVYAATGVNDLYFENSPKNPVFAVQPIYKTDGRLVYARVTNGLFFGTEKNEKLPANAKIGVLYTNDDAGKSIKAGIDVEVALGNNAANVEFMAFEASNVDTIVAAMMAKNPEAIIVAGNQAPFNSALVALHDKGNEAPVFTSYVNTNAASITNQAYNFDIYGQAWLDLSTTGGFADYQEFVATMTAGGYGADAGANNYTGNAFAMAGFVAAHVFLSGLENLGEEKLTVESFIDAMEAKPIPVKMGGTLDYSDGKRWGIGAMSLSKYVPGNASADPVVPASFVKVAEIQTLDEIKGN